MYELIVHLLEPYTLVLLCLLAALAGIWRRQRPRTISQIAATVLTGLLIALSVPTTGYLAMETLESAYPPTNDVPASHDILVILSHGIIRESRDRSIVRLDHASTARCLHAVQLYKRSGGCRVVLSGGKTDWSDPSPTLAEVMRRFVVEVGIHPDDILLEDKSSNTYENALFSKALLKNQPGNQIWLVTAASHMHRAEDCFRKQGFVVIPAPCDHQPPVWNFSLCNFIPTADGIKQVARAAHEWQGRIWYRLRGWI